MNYIHLYTCLVVSNYRQTRSSDPHGLYIGQYSIGRSILDGGGGMEGYISRIDAL